MEAAAEDEEARVGVDVGNLVEEDRIDNDFALEAAALQFPKAD